MEQGSRPQGIGQTKGVRQPSSQGQCLMTPLQGLVWIAETPQGPGCIGEAPHPRVSRIDGGARVLLRVIQCKRLLQVGPSRAQLSKKVQCGPQSHVSQREEISVLAILGQP